MKKWVMFCISLLTFLFSMECLAGRVLGHPVEIKNSAVSPHAVQPFRLKTGRSIATRAWGQLKTPTGSAGKRPLFSAPPSLFSTETAVTAAEGDAVTISVGIEGFFSAGGAVGDMLEKQLGIRLSPVDVGDWDSAALELFAESGALPDITRVNIQSAYFQRWVNDGVIRSLPAALTYNYGRVAEVMRGSDELRAVNALNRRLDWFIPVRREGPAVDSGRIYYRKDLAGETAPPETIEDFAALLRGYAETNETGLALAGGVTYLIALFGADPLSWIYENGEWIPAYYSEKMLNGLRFARILYDAGVLDRDYALTKAGDAVEQLAEREAGALIRHGDAYWLMRVLTEFSEKNGITAAEANQWYIGILPPPAASFTEAAPGALARFWPRSVETGGCVVSASADDSKLNAILRLLEFSLSPAGKELAYFGLRGETSATDADGTPRLLINPATARPYDILERYPSARALFLLEPTQDRLAERDVTIPSLMPPSVKITFNEAERAYAKAAINEGDGFIIRFLHTPAKDQLELDIDYAAAFNEIVAGTAPVAEMFAAFRQGCEEKNIRAAIHEVNARMRRL